MSAEKLYTEITNEIIDETNDIEVLRKAFKTSLVTQKMTIDLFNRRVALTESIIEFNDILIHEHSQSNRISALADKIMLLMVISTIIITFASVFMTHNPWFNLGYIPAWLMSYYFYRTTQILGEPKPVKESIEDESQSNN